MDWTSWRLGVVVALLAGCASGGSGGGTRDAFEPDSPDARSSDGGDAAEPDSGQPPNPVRHDRVGDAEFGDGRLGRPQHRRRR